MKTMIKYRVVAAILLSLTSFLCPLEMKAQDKLFTLEDLNFGGTNYRNLQPKNMWLTWWGDQLMYQDAEEGGSIDAKGNRKALFSLKDVDADLHSAMDRSEK